MLPMSYFNLIESFPKSGCAICHLLRQEALDLIDSILYEYVTDPEINRKFRDSRGLCNQHAWLMAEQHKALGITILYEAALDEVLKIINQVALPDGQWRKLPRLLSWQTPQASLIQALAPTQPCLVCQEQRLRAGQLTDCLGTYIGHEAMQTAYRHSEGLCLEHFKAVLQKVQNSDDARLLLAIQYGIWDSLRDELRAFMEKNNQQGHGEAVSIGAERDSWRRAVARLVGEKGVFSNKP